MHSEDMLAELVTVFPELELEGVDWNKEVFAHFGLVFMKVALLEHCLINAYTAIFAAKDFKESKYIPRKTGKTAMIGPLTQQRTKRLEI